MHLLMVTGFLGSGKTTLVIQITQAAIQQGRRVAILVNEIGEIGIDDQLMKQLDLNVWEMVNGCICCTLAADLVTTLHQLDDSYDVDLVILEPSGAAEPNNILRTLPYYKGRPLESIRSVSILDPLRFPELYQVLTPLIVKQVAYSELLLVTKADLATPEQVEETRAVAAEINPEAPVRVLSTREPLAADLLGELLPWTN
jgi:G3E family GTPase